MIAFPSGVRVYLALAATDMRKGFDGLSMLAQQVLAQDPFSGHLFVFRGKRGDLLKILYWDGQGFCLFAKRLEKGRFVWPLTKEGSVTLTPAQLSMLLEGIDWVRSTTDMGANARGMIAAKARSSYKTGMQTAGLPDDVLKQLVAERTAELAAAKAGLIAKTLEADKLKFELARLKRSAYGQSSERLDREIEQLELKLQEIEAEAAEAPEPPLAAGSAQSEPVAPTKKPRRQLPEHLPRQTETHEPQSCACPRCGTGRMRRVGEDVTEVLTYIPSRFEVIRHVRPAYSCSKCEAMTQAPMPPLPIPRGIGDASVIAHILMSKYADHLPLYRQSEIYARSGVDLDRGLLAGWVGKAAWLVRPLVEKIAVHVMTGTVIHADDTPVPVLAPGKGKTKTGRLWVYLRDERPHGGHAPAAVLYRYTPDRKGERCREHLKSFSGHLHADGYAGFGELYESVNGNPAAVTEVACWAHVRRKFYDVHKANGSPIAQEALEKIGALFGIERNLMSKPPDQRCEIRQSQAKPKLDELAAWLDA